MKLVMTFGGRDSVTNWTDSSNRFLTERLIRGNKIGYRHENITCREVICNRIREARNAQTNLILEGNLDRGRFTPEIQVKEIPKKSIDKFLHNFELENYFSYSRYYFLKGENSEIEPSVYSAMAFLLKYYSKFLVDKNAYQISLEVLNNVLTSFHTSYRIDHIFTAYFIYLLLDVEYRHSVRHYFFNSYWINGPGQFIHKNLSLFMNISDNAGYTRADKWWKKKEVKSLLIAILEKYKFESHHKKIIRMLMEK